MALSTSLFLDKVGVAVIRQNLTTGEFFFVRFVTGSVDFVADTPGPGPWAYYLWAVNGRNSNVPQITANGQQCTIVAMNTKR